MAWNESPVAGAALHICFVAVTESHPLVLAMYVRKTVFLKQFDK